jgi:hypothetical protein
VVVARGDAAVVARDSGGAWRLRHNAAARRRMLDGEGSATRRCAAEHRAAKARWNVSGVTARYAGGGCVMLARGRNQESFSNGHPKSRVVTATRRVV